MVKHEESQCVKTYSKNHAISFKSKVIKEIEQGRTSTYKLSRKHGIQTKIIF